MPVPLMTGKMPVPLMTGKMPVPLMTGKMPVPLEEGLKQGERLQFNGLAEENQGPEVEWEKIFDRSDDDLGYSVQQTTDGGYIIAGNTYSYGAGDYDVYLIKLKGEAVFPNQSPIASFTYITNGLLATFTSTSTDPEGGPLTYLWDFGDGTSSTEQNPEHYYDLAGKHQVTLKVVDGKGLSAAITQEITVESLILSVTYPSFLGQGLPLKIRVVAAKETSITLNLGDFTQTKQGKIVEFNIDTTSFTPGRYDLTIKVENEEYKGEVNIYNPLAYQEVISKLKDLENLTEKEMQEMANLTGSTLVDIGYDWLAKKTSQVVLNWITKEYAKDLLDYLTGNTLPLELTDVSKSELSNFHQYLQAAGLGENERAAFGEAVEIILHNLDDNLAEVLGKTPGNALDWITEGGISPDKLKEWLTEHITGPAVYSIFCSNKQNLIQARTEGAALGLQNRIFTPEEINVIQNTLNKGKKAIQNTSEERIYRLQIGPLPVINKTITAQPALPYFKAAHHQSLNPGGFLGLNKYNPAWVWDMTLADLQSVLTIGAELGWITATPDKEFQAKFAFIPILVKAAEAYIKYVNILDKTSPPIISGLGMGMGTDLLAKALDYKHDKILQAALSGQKMQGLDLAGAKTKSSSFKDTAYQAGQENPALTIAITPEKPHYEPGEMAKLNISITNQSNETIEDALWWLIVPEENLVVKDAVYLAPASTVSQTYEFTVNNPGLHLGQAYLTVFTDLVAQNYTTFTVGGGSQKGALLKADYQPEYSPGEISLEVTVQNIGRENLNLILLYNNSSVQLPEIPAGESIKHTLTLSCPEPGTYTVPLAVKENVAEQDTPLLDAQLVTFKVKPIDILSAFCTCDKPVYSVGERVYTTVRIENAAGEEVSVPYILEIKTPSGQIINQKDFIADQSGTYLIRVTPDLSGYENIPAETFFLVERQSDLKLQALLVPEGMEIIVKTDAGGPVSGAKVILGEQSKFSGSDGKVKFIRPLTAEVFVRAEKTGFNPVQEMLNLTDLEKASITGQAGCEKRIDQSGIAVTLEGTDALAGTSYTAATAADGLFAFTGLEPGAYILTAGLPGFLKAGRTVTAAAYETTDVGELLLLAGDLSGDNVVDIDDLLLLRQTYGTIQGEIGFNPVADFNVNDRIDLIDLILLARNYTKEGFAY